MAVASIDVSVSFSGCHRFDLSYAAWNFNRFFSLQLPQTTRATLAACLSLALRLCAFSPQRSLIPLRVVLFVLV